MLTMDGVGQKRVHFAVPEGYPITSGTFGKTGMPPQPSTGLRTRNAMLRFSSRRQGKKPALASWYSPVAQLVEQRTVNPRVPGSSPGGGAFGFSTETPANPVNARSQEIGGRAFFV